MKVRYCGTLRITVAERPFGWCQVTVTVPAAVVARVSTSVAGAKDAEDAALRALWRFADLGIMLTHYAATHRHGYLITKKPRLATWTG